MPLQSDNRYSNKYQFHLLDIGDSMFVPGRLENIRSAASMWGKRQSIWLRVVRAESGATVTRTEGPITKVRNQQLEIMNALRTLTLLVLEMKQKMEDAE